MSQQQRAKSPLDVLQGMINLILIETGKALRASNKEGGKGLTNASNRLRGLVPTASENLHSTLDDLECEIIRAKSVLLRDLEGLRSKRMASENPIPSVEEEVIAVYVEESPAQTVKAENAPKSPLIKDEQELRKSPEKPAPTPETKPIPSDLAESKDQKVFQDIKELQISTLPSSVSQSNPSNKPIGLGINTDGMTTTSAPDTGDPQHSAVDSLFGPDTADYKGGSEINFDDMDFGLDTDANANTQSLEQSQTQNAEFDLSNFGDSAQDFNMDGLQPANISADSKPDQNAAKRDDINDMSNKINNNTVGDTMDLDMDFGPAEGEDSVFDDIFFGGGDDTMAGGGEMEHEFDNAFFGLDTEG